MINPGQIREEVIHDHQPNPVSTRISLSEFLKAYGSEKQCETALAKARLPKFLFVLPIRVGSRDLLIFGGLSDQPSQNRLICADLEELHGCQLSHSVVGSI